MKYPMKALLKKKSAIGENFENVHIHTQNKGWENSRTRNYECFLEEE